jgi:hypothetical protein
MARLKNWFEKYSDARTASKARKYLGHIVAKVTKLNGKNGKPSVRYYVATPVSIGYLRKTSKGRYEVTVSSK